MGQPKTRTNGPQLFHVNFHTVRNRAVFEVPEYRELVERFLIDVLTNKHIGCLAWQVMPTHVHLIVASFPDLPLSRVIHLIKGGTAHAFLATAPELREDLGDHLWQEGYDWVEITTQRQCANTIRYVRENRIRGGLEP